MPISCFSLWIYCICAVEILTLIYNNSFYWEATSTWCMLVFLCVGEFSEHMAYLNSLYMHFVSPLSVYLNYVSVAE